MGLTECVYILYRLLQNNTHYICVNIHVYKYIKPFFPRHISIHIVTVTFSTSHSLSSLATFSSPSTYNTSLSLKYSLCVIYPF